jgi:hypothetical protein
MADPKTDTTAPDEELGGENDTSFTTDTVHANRDIHEGLGVGARELAAQRDATGAQPPPELPEDLDDKDDDDARTFGA